MSKSAGGAKKKGANAAAWDTLFDELDIIAQVANNGFFDISADQIKKYGKREPRLMAKMDFREQQPKVMADNKLALLATSNGLYRIAKFDPFIDLAPRNSLIKPLRMPIPSGIISLDAANLKGESAILEAASVSGALNRAFGEKVDLTIRGRLHCPKISFVLGGTTWNVGGVQVEVDGGYEGPTSINLMEAKIGGPTNISIRQILYPQKSWEAQVVGAKLVRSFVALYEEPIMRIIPVAETNGVWAPNHAKEQCFQFENSADFDLKSVAVCPGTVHKAPFPQADRFDTVLAMFTKVALAVEDLSSEFDIVPRQICYYASAMRWLGLVEDGTPEAGLSLSAFGLEVWTMTHAERIEALARVVFCEPIFHHVLHHPGEAVPGHLFAPWGITGSTQIRRLQTVRAWVDYFIEQTTV